MNETIAGCAIPENSPATCARYMIRSESYANAISTVLAVLDATAMRISDVSRIFRNFLKTSRPKTVPRITEKGRVLVTDKAVQFNSYYFGHESTFPVSSLIQSHHMSLYGTFFYGGKLYLSRAWSFSGRITGKTIFGLRNMGTPRSRQEGRPPPTLTIQLIFLLCGEPTKLGISPMRYVVATFLPWYASNKTVFLFCELHACTCGYG